MGRSQASMMLVAISIFSVLAYAVDATVKVSIIGDPVDVWSSVETMQKCNNSMIDVPDIPARAFVDDNGVTHMIVGDTNFHYMSGPCIINVSRSCFASWNMTGNPDPSMFAGNEFLDSPHVFENGTVVALVHTEFPGNIYNTCNGPAYPYCWTVTIGLAVSHDWGKTWQHARPPPYHLVAAVPYTYNESQLAYGWGDPSNIIRNQKDGYYYVAMWNRNKVGLQEPGICVARTSNLMDPSSWRGWNGHDFSVTFVSPYEMDPSNHDIENHICTVVNLPAPNCAALGLVWSVYLKKFVVTLGCIGGIMGKAFHLATSNDLIHWSDTQPFYSENDMPPNVRKQVTGFNYPTFLDPSASSAFGDVNYYTIGQSPYLFWVSLGHSVYSDGRHLWATPMRFSNETVESGGLVIETSS